MTQDELDKLVAKLIELFLPKGSTTQAWVRGFSIYIDGELVMEEGDKLHHLAIVRKLSND